MVLFFTSTAIDPPASLYMGRDKHENEDLLRYGDEQDVWFHVDKLSSAHVYLRLPEGMEWDAIPAKLLDDAAQLVKANSIEGNRRDNQTIIYTPWSNVKKTGDMAIGSVTFHNDRRVRRVYVKARDNAVVNRLNKTKREEKVDHEAVRIEREKEKQRRGKERERVERNEALERARQHKAAKEAQDYSGLYSEEAMEEARREKERRARAKKQEEEERRAAGAADEEDQEDGNMSDDSFM